MPGRRWKNEKLDHYLKTAIHKISFPLLELYFRYWGEILMNFLPSSSLWVSSLALINASGMIEKEFTHRSAWVSLQHLFSDFPMTNEDKILQNFHGKLKQRKQAKLSWRR